MAQHENVNDMVRTIQRFIGAGQDGEWGSQTNARFTEALRVIQAQLGIKSDGWVGNQTVSALENAMREGKLNKEFGAAVISLFENKPVSLSSLQSRHGDDGMHDALMARDPRTGDYRVQGGTNDFNLNMLMPGLHSAAAPEPPAIQTSVPLGPHFETAAQPTAPRSTHTPDLPPAAPKPVMEASPPVVAEPLPQRLSETAPMKPVPGTIIDTKPASPSSTTPAFAAASVPGPTPSGSPFGFGKGSMGATIDDAVYHGNEAAMVAAGLHSDGMAQGRLTLMDAVIWQRAYASSDASPDQSSDKVNSYCNKFGIDGSQQFDTSDPRQLQSLMGRLSGYVNGVPSQSLPSSWTDQFSKEAYNATGQTPPAQSATPVTQRPTPAQPGMGPQ